MFLLVTAALAACTERGNETRTFELAHLNPEQAQLMVEPYVEGGGGSIRRTDRPTALTITESPERLRQIEELLERFDVPSPTVRLRFQLIEADGYTQTDSAIADVEQALRQLFRFRGYRLAAETVITGQGRTETKQSLMLPGDVPVQLTAHIWEISSVEGRKAVQMTVQLKVHGMDALETGITVPNGQTVVLGSAQPIPNMGSLILVVRPVIE